jgi:ribosomal protein S12 methylthiotransferase
MADSALGTTTLPDRGIPPTDPAQAARVRVAMLTLGCARNEVDSEELAARLEAGGFELTDDADSADAVMVNTCGFVEQAKKDSVDALLAAADLRDSGRPRAVVAVGCLAERYGEQLAAELPEADAVLGFDSYVDIATTLQSVLDGAAPAPHVPRDRRTLLPLSPTDRAGSGSAVPGHGAPTLAAPDLPDGMAPASGPRALRRRLGSGPSVPLKIASGCDRRCAFCAIPSFRGAFLSRRPTEVIDEARWLLDQGGVRELFLVSENSTSYGKDLGDLRLLETLLPELAALPGDPWIRVSYLQPAEVRPGLIDVMTSTAGVLPYFDLSFQHASGPLLRRMRRFGDAKRFLELIASIRERQPTAGIRSNVIVGFPGETEDDLAILRDFLTQARLDAVGVFGYSDEDGTEAERLTGKIDPDEVLDRAAMVQDLVDELVSQRAEDRIGDTVDVLVETVDSDGVEGRAVHQGPDVDGSTRVIGADGAKPGDVVSARVTDSDGVDLVAVAA